jgi:hypothetical protein
MKDTASKTIGIRGLRRRLGPAIHMLKEELHSTVQLFHGCYLGGKIHRRHHGVVDLVATRSEVSPSIPAGSSGIAAHHIPLFLHERYQAGYMCHFKICSACPKCTGGASPCTSSRAYNPWYIGPPSPTIVFIKMPSVTRDRNSYNKEGRKRYRAMCSSASIFFEG